jgi:hypothetical protein
MGENQNQQVAQAASGLNLNGLNPSNGQLSYALNSVVEGIDGQGISYQNEPGFTHCTDFPEGYLEIGKKAIPERGIILFWLANPHTGGSEMGQVKDCVYTTLINSSCLGFSPDYPIHKAFYRIIHCGTEVYWTDGRWRRYINLDKLPWVEVPDQDGCGFIDRVGEVDCNKLLVQPNFSIPSIDYKEVSGDGQLTAGTYQFTTQYANKDGEGYTSYYSVTNPLPIQDPTRITLDFNYPVNKAISLDISGIDVSGVYEYLNLAVIKTVNNISSFELVGSYRIEGGEKHLVYSGQKLRDLSEGDIFEKFPVYPVADTLYSVQGVLGWVGMTGAERINYQQIASQIIVGWEMVRLPKDAYKDPVLAAAYRGYMRDEVYPLEFVPLLTNGRQCDGFHIPGPQPTSHDLELVHSEDVPETDCERSDTAKPRWQVENTAVLDWKDLSPQGCEPVAVRRGRMGYWESTETYPCNKDIWGSLSGRPIRHHRMPDCTQAPHYGENGEVIYALGLRIDVNQVLDLIRNSSLTPEQKASIQGFKIVRGNRAGGQKSVIAKGLLHSVGKAQREGTTVYYPNYPLNDLRPDSFLRTSLSSPDSGHNSDRLLNGFSDPLSRYAFHSPDTHFYQPSLGNLIKLETVEYGTAQGHFVPVKDHSRYKFLTALDYSLALGAGAAAALLSLGLDGIDTGATLPTMKALLDIIEKLSPRTNFCYQFNTVGTYNKSLPVPVGNKQRTLELAAYTSPGLISVGDDHLLNNFQRESSVYLKTVGDFPAPHSYPGVPQDLSRFTLHDAGFCSDRIVENPTSAYYGTIKQNLAAQWGQLYSYETIDTGFQWLGSLNQNLQQPFRTIFGGDTFIGRFAYKTKMPFFLDNRVGVQDESDIEYSQLGNVAYPNYWLDTDNEEGTSFEILNLEIGNFWRKEQ